jgi:hypothetical protein
MRFSAPRLKRAQARGPSVASQQSRAYRRQLGRAGQHIGPPPPLPRKSRNRPSPGDKDWSLWSIPARLEVSVRLGKPTKPLRYLPKLSPVTASQFLSKSSHMASYGHWPNAQTGSYLLVGQPLTEQREHLQFACRKHRLQYHHRPPSYPKIRTIDSHLRLDTPLYASYAAASISVSHTSTFVECDSTFVDCGLLRGVQRFVEYRRGYGSE